MADIHITRELLWAVSRGELPPGVITRIGMEHLLNLCPACRREMSAFREERSRPARKLSGEALRVFPAVFEDQVARLDREVRVGVRDLEELLALPADERVRRVERARRRFRSGVLARLLIAESRNRVHAAPEEAFRLAALARLVAQLNPRMRGVFDVIALATASMANACRAGGDLRGAEEHFGSARSVIVRQGVTDLEVLARVDHLEGSLCMDQRRFSQAEELLARSAMLFRLSGDKVELARVLTTLGGLYFFRDDLDQAIAATTAALQGLRPGSETRLFLCARYNLARYLTEDGQLDAAEEILSADAGLYGELPEPSTQLRLLWLRGKIAAGRGRIAEAERAFVEVRDGFLALGIGYDAAMVAIEDLAFLYLRQGRAADVKRLAEEIFPVFQAQDVHREAVAALRLFQEAARQEQVTLQTLRNLSRYLRDARADPTLRFRHSEPS
jgi:tetratricopeptide (TPR) repeat protein